MNGLAWLRGLRRTFSPSDSSSDCFDSFPARAAATLLLGLTLLAGFAADARADGILTISAPEAVPSTRSAMAERSHLNFTDLVFQVRLTNAVSAQVPFKVCFSGTASRAAGDDYQTLLGTTVQTTACVPSFIAAGHTAPSSAQTVGIRVNADNLIEFDETVTATLSLGADAPWDVGLGTREATHTILNDDTEVEFGESTIVGREGGRVRIPVVLASKLPHSATIRFTYTGLATKWTDYDASNTSLTFRRGQTRRDLYVNLPDDADFDDNEGFAIDIDAGNLPAGIQAGSTNEIRVTIKDNDYAISTDLSSYTVREDAGGASVEVIIDPPQDEPVGVRVSIWNITAKGGVEYFPGVDYLQEHHSFPDGVVTFRALQARKRIYIPVVNDGAGDGESNNELFQFNLTQEDGAQQTTSNTNVFIKALEPGNRASRLRIAVDGSDTVREGQSAKFKLTMDRPLEEAATVAVGLAQKSDDGARSEWLAAPTTHAHYVTVKFAKGDSENTLSLPIANDGRDTDGSLTAVLMQPGLHPASSGPFTLYSGATSDATVRIRDGSDGLRSPSTAPAVQVPTTQVANVQASTIDAASATVTWDAVEHATSYQVEWDGENADQTVAIAGSKPNIAGTSTTIQHDTPEAMTLTIKVIPVYIDDNGATRLLNDLAGTATLDVGSAGTQDSDQTTAPSACVSPELQSTVEGYTRENYGDAHVQRWKKVLKAFAREPGGMTGTQARQMEAKYSANRWKPVAEAIECLETEAQTTPDPVPVTDDDDTTGPNPYADLIEQMIEWRNDPKWKNYKTHTDRWDRALLAFGENVSDTTLTPMTAQEAQGYADKGMTRWIEVAQALAEIESRDQTDTQTDTTPPDPVPVILPELSLSAGSGVEEGENTEFTITSTPAPQSDLEITFSVTQSGDYLTTPEPTSRTMTLTAGSTSTTLSFATEDDQTDETDGSVQVTLAPGTDYTIASGQQSGTVIVQDNDEPVVSVTAGDAVPEGDPATFTVSASPTPASPLTVTLSIAQSGEYISGQTGSREIVIPTEGILSVEIPTEDDHTDEADGSITATVLAQDGYTVAASPDDVATVTVTDNDEAVASIPSLSVEDAQAHESEGRLSFSVRLNPPSKTKVTVWAWLRESDPVSAREGVDYRSWNAWNATRLIFPAGTTERTLAVPIINDSHDEEAETFEIRLSNATGGALIEKQTGIMTIVNSDPMPAAWLSRFGRTVAQQALDGIATRISAPRNAGTQGALAGQTLNANDSVGRSDSSDTFDTWTPFTRPSVNIADSLTDSFAHPHGFSESRPMSGMSALLGSHFTVTEETGISGESLSYWGRAAQSSFDGQEGTFSLDGEATTAMLGADYARNQWMAGFALMKSNADGTYTDTKVTPRPDTQDCPGMEPICMNAVREGDGQIEASLTSLIPYTAIQTSPNMKWWGAFGYGTGETTLKPEPGGSYSSDISWNMAALGMRADLIQPDNGPALALTSDALWTNTESDQTQDLAASDSNTTRLRMGLEGNWKTETKDGGQFTPKIEVGVRHDGGDAETGLGMEVGAGIIWTNPNTGLHLDLSGRTLMTHDSDELKDQGFAAALAFDPQPQSERGWSFSIRQEIGGAAQGGLDALFQEDPLSDRTSNPQSRWTTRAQYGYPAGNGDWTATPQISLGMSTDQRELQLGWSITPLTNKPDWSFTVQTTRREQESHNPVQSVGVGWRMRW